MVMVRNLLVGGCALTLGFGSLAVAAPASADCPAGTVATHFDGVCEAAPAGSQQGVPAVVNPSGPGAGSSSIDGLPAVDGIPCNPQHIGTCIGLGGNP